jgi:peroxiredoxin
MMALDPLQPALDRFKADWEARVGEGIASMIAGDIDDLRATGILDRVAKPGELWPTAALRDAHGQPFDLTGRLTQRPAIITFYRGGWCPYCNLELRAWQLRLGDIRAAGADLVAISPELPDHSLTTAEKNELAYPVLSDLGGALAACLGIRFMLSDTVQPFYERAGHALPERNGDGVWALPIPATFVVAKGGRIAAAFVEPDYRKRPDPAAVLAGLHMLQNAEAA